MSIFVGNLPFRAERDDVLQLFAPFGEVMNCSLPLERDTGRKRGFAFVEMADETIEAAAIEGLQGCELMGRPLRINKAEPRGGEVLEEVEEEAMAVEIITAVAMVVAMAVEIITAVAMVVAMAVEIITVVAMVVAMAVEITVVAMVVAMAVEIITAVAMVVAMAVEIITAVAMVVAMAVEITERDILNKTHPLKTNLLEQKDGKIEVMGSLQKIPNMKMEDLEENVECQMQEIFQTRKS